jgi:hypothetical protein
VARLAHAYGMSGWVLKSHLWATTDREGGPAGDGRDRAKPNRAMMLLRGVSGPGNVASSYDLNNRMPHRRAFESGGSSWVRWQPQHTR